MSGTGKSEVLKESQHILNDVKGCSPQAPYITAAPTHKACKIVNGITLHRLFDINPLTYSYSYNKVSQLKANGIEYIFIDEISMIGEQLWNVIAHIKKQFEFTFCGFGDFKQLKPVNEEQTDFKNAWLLKYIYLIIIYLN